MLNVTINKILVLLYRKRLSDRPVSLSDVSSALVQFHFFRSLMNVLVFRLHFRHLFLTQPLPVLISVLNRDVSRGFMKLAHPQLLFVGWNWTHWLRPLNSCCVVRYRLIIEWFLKKKKKRQSTVSKHCRSSLDVKPGWRTISSALFDKNKYCLKRMKSLEVIYILSPDVTLNDCISFDSALETVIVALSWQYCYNVGGLYMDLVSKKRVCNDGLTALKVCEFRYLCVCVCAGSDTGGAMGAMISQNLKKRY